MIVYGLQFNKPNSRYIVPSALDLENELEAQSCFFFQISEISQKKSLHLSLSRNSNSS